MSLGLRMEEMIFNLADTHLFFNDLEVRPYKINLLTSAYNHYNQSYYQENGQKKKGVKENFAFNNFVWDECDR